MSDSKSWLERIRKENPAFLTIVSLELPESPIPLIESQANARWRGGNFNFGAASDDKDDILDEFLKKIALAEKEREERESRAGRNNLFCRRRRQTRKDGGKNDGDSSERTKPLATLEECTRNIIQGRIGEESSERGDECVYSEIPKDPRINIRGRTREELVPCTPEVANTIRIAMKYRRRLNCKSDADDDDDDDDDDESLREKDEEEGQATKNEGNKKDLQGPPNARREPVKQDARCVTAGVNAALDFTLNCNSVRLTSRDASLRTATRSER